MVLMHDHELAPISDIDWEKMVVKIASAVVELPVGTKRETYQSAIRKALMELEFRSPNTQANYRQLFGRLYLRN